MEVSPHLKPAVGKGVKASYAGPAPCLSLFARRERSPMYSCLLMLTLGGRGPTHSERARSVAGVASPPVPGAVTLPSASRGQPRPLLASLVSGERLPSAEHSPARRGKDP